MDYMRQQIASIYGPLFVSDMPPRQVAAVYNNMKSRGKFDKKSKEEPEFYQMNIFDWLFETKGAKVWETQ
jgi:hypothetical protein